MRGAIVHAQPLELTRHVGDDLVCRMLVFYLDDERRDPRRVVGRAKLSRLLHHLGELRVGLDVESVGA